MEEDKRIRILVAEDEEDFADLLKLILEPEGFKVKITENGREAVECVDDFKPDLAVLDINMPYKDGFEVCRTIRSNPRFCGIPVIFLTVRKNDTEKIRGLEIEGSDDYITKPFKPRELVARIKNVLKRTKIKGVR